MAIEIKELVIRAIVDTQAEHQEGASLATPEPQMDSMLTYLESLMKNLDKKQER